jgi:hypothetical protein
MTLHALQRVRAFQAFCIAKRVRPSDRKIHEAGKSLPALVNGLCASVFAEETAANFCYAARVQILENDRAPTKRKARTDIQIWCT